MIRDWTEYPPASPSIGSLRAQGSNVIYFAYSCSPLAVAHTNSSLIAVLSPVEHRDFIFPAQLSRLS